MWQRGGLFKSISLLAQFLDGESEVGVGKRLVAEREVPPLRVKGLEAVGEHGAAQYHAVLELLGGDAALRLGGRFAIVARIFTRVGIAAEVGMALGAEPVEGAAHVKFLFRGHVEERQIDGRAAGVTTALIDVLLLEEH